RESQRQAPLSSPSQPCVNRARPMVNIGYTVFAGMPVGPGHVSHRFQQAAISCLRRQSAHAPHSADAAAFVRRARGLRVRGRRDRARNVQPLRSGYRHHRLVDADLRRARTGADDPATGIEGQSLRSHHHVDRPFPETARDGGVTEFLAKPISAKGLYQRILNVVANPRPFIKTKTYFGPDRRRNTANAYSGPERRTGGEVEVLQQPSLLDKARSGA